MRTQTSAALLSISLLSSSLASVGCGCSRAAAAPRAAVETPDAARSAMHARAAEEGLDGIYGIDCSKEAKVCTAKGFVYDKVSPAMPEINARKAASESKPADLPAFANR